MWSGVQPELRSCRRSGRRTGLPVSLCGLRLLIRWLALHCVWSVKHFNLNMALVYVAPQMTFAPLKTQLDPSHWLVWFWTQLSGMKYSCCCVHTRLFGGTKEKFWIVIVWDTNRRIGCGCLVRPLLWVSSLRSVTRPADEYRESISRRGEQSFLLGPRSTRRAVWNLERIELERWQRSTKFVATMVPTGNSLAEESVDCTASNHSSGLLSPVHTGSRRKTASLCWNQINLAS